LGDDELLLIVQLQQLNHHFEEKEDNIAIMEKDRHLLKAFEYKE
jgi:hypothetical protein